MDLDKLMKQLGEIDYTKSTSYESAFRMFNASLKYPTYTLPLKKGSLTYRSRTNPEFKQLSNINELSYLLVEYVKDFGRANRPFQTFLYTSDTAETTYLE